MVHLRDKLVNLQLDGKNIMRCGYNMQEEAVKLLGVYIDEELDWKVHVNNVIKKISKGNYILWRHSKKLDIPTKKVLYESFVRSHLLYCLPVWGSAKNTVLKPLINSIKKIWKRIGPYKLHTLNRLKNYSILKFEHELEIQESKIVWKWSSAKLPIGLRMIIKEKEHSLRARRFQVDRNAKHSSINYRLYKRARDSICTIANYKSAKSLTYNLKKKILDQNYVYNCTRRNCFICQ